MTKLLKNLNKELKQVDNEIESLSRYLELDYKINDLLNRKINDLNKDELYYFDELLKKNVMFDLVVNDECYVLTNVLGKFIICDRESPKNKDIQEIKNLKDYLDKNSYLKDAIIETIY